MAFIKKKSVLPIYLVGVTWLVWAIFLPLYRPTHYIMAALVSAIVYFVGKMIWPDRGFELEDEPEPEQTARPEPERTEPEPQQPPREEEKPASTGDPAIDALITERDRAISEMRRLNDTIEDEAISAQIDHLEAVTGKIIGAVVDKPSKLPQLRRFLNYYLPTTLKLLNAYDRMGSAGVEGANIDGTMGRIDAMMDKVVQAFDKQLDALFADEALDISTDITVLGQMLAREGLGGMQMGQS